MEKSAIYEHLHNEKISPIFLKLSKCRNSGAKLSDICKDDGSAFPDTASQNDFIVDFFRNIYSGPPGFARPEANAIEEFLGNEICAHPIVTNSKISAADQQRLEQSITLQELDLAAEESKTRTACGPDGVNNAFIKKFWHMLRIPLHKYAKKCFNEGRLTPGLAAGSIRLIPKKGDISRIKNWRPISLLNCSYKIISRAINNRLKSVCDNILSRAQKGFTSSRYIQEVLINVLENIAYCNSNRIAGSVISIDMAKAFDSLNHDFMELTWRFFGFGENFIRYLNTLTRGRASCIILDDNSYSTQFDIKTGTLQGDSPSPLIYNFNQQILLFKIELDPGIASIFVANLVPRPVFPATQPFEHESNRETDKTDGFADDTTVYTKTDIHSLRNLKNILVEFGNISGLICNIDKTNIMAVGDRTALSNEIINLGFPIVDEIKLLGVSIDHELNCITASHDKTVENISKVIDFWSRFRLSLPGRLGIAKTLCLSQINYVGCIITPTANQLKEMSSLIFNYIKGSLNISKDRITLPTNMGGLGFPDISKFIISQQTVWIKRANISCRDNWRFDLRAASNGNCLTAAVENFSFDRHPILRFITQSYNLFLKEFLANNDNYKLGLLLNNPTICRNRQDPGPLNLQIFNQNPPIRIEKIVSLRFCDIFSNNSVKMLWEINRDSDCNINILTYMRLGAACNNFNQSINRNRISDGSSISTSAFFNSFKKGSKSVRRILSYNSINKPAIENKKHVKSYFRLVGLPVPDPSTIKKLFGAWGYNFLQNNLREFILKFFSNILGLNVRIAHFVQGASRNCFFCSQSNPVILTDESFAHLFLDCPITNSWLLSFETLFFPEINFTSRMQRLSFWFSHTVPAELCPLNNFEHCSLWIFKFLIWEAKLKKKVPSFVSFKIDFLSTTDSIVKISKQIAHESNNGNYSISRNWAGLVQAEQ